jgi:glycosyltransferase involved in cell wall biosynthesis
VLLRQSLRAAARVICLGASQRVELVDAARLEPDRVLTMLIPVDEQFFAPRGDGDARGVLTVGKDLARDYGTFLEAVAPLGVEATLVAHPRNLAGLELPANARLAPAGLPFTALRDEYAGAACVVLPQYSDAFAFGSEGGGLTALLEAMAMGRPIVATDRAILRDYVEDGVDALLVPPEDPAALRAAVERVLGDPELARSLGAAARARVERAHTSREFAARLAPVLRSVV